MRLIFAMFFFGLAIYWAVIGLKALFSGNLLYAVGVYCVAYICFGVTVAIVGED